MALKSHIPNLITLGNLLCGTLAIFSLSPKGSTVFGFLPTEEIVLILVGIALLCDFLDGAVARLLKATSPLGAQLDSLSDLVTFGVLPGILMMDLMMPNLPWIFPYPDRFLVPLELLLVFPLLLPLAAAYRLARFNVETVNSTGFQGLPAPASGLFFVAIYWLGSPSADTSIWDFLYHPIALAALCLVFALLMISRWHHLSLKFSGFGLQANLVRYLLLGISLILLLVWSMEAVPAIMLVYLLLSLIDDKVLKPLRT